MVATALLREGIWFEQVQYEKAETDYHLRLAGRPQPVAVGSHVMWASPINENLWFEKVQYEKAEADHHRKLAERLQPASSDPIEVEKPTETAVEKSIVAKSRLVYEIRPWDEDIDMVELQRLVRTIEMEGLVWDEQAEVVNIGNGMSMLKIPCVIEDEKVTTDDLDEKITAFEDFVQSVDIASYDKI